MNDLDMSRAGEAQARIEQLQAELADANAQIANHAGLLFSFNLLNAKRFRHKFIDLTYVVIDEDVELSFEYKSAKPCERAQRTFEYDAKLTLCMDEATRKLTVRPRGDFSSFEELT